MSAGLIFGKVLEILALLGPLLSVVSCFHVIDTTACTWLCQRDNSELICFDSLWLPSCLGAFVVSAEKSGITAGDD